MYQTWDILQQLLKISLHNYVETNLSMNFIEYI